MGVRLHGSPLPSQRDLLDAKLQQDFVGGESRIDEGDQIVYFDYWGRDKTDALRVGERLVQTMLNAFAGHACQIVRRVGPDRTWPGARRGIDRPTRLPV